MIDTGMEWICQGLVGMVYRLLQLNSISGDGCKGLGVQY